MTSSAIDNDTAARRAHAQQIGLFRYQLICPALDDRLGRKARGALVRRIAAREHPHPDGTQVRYSRESIDRWIRAYRRGGFDALCPAPRNIAARTDPAVLELAAGLKRENPDRTTAQVRRILAAHAGWAPSESTLLRHFHRCELAGPAARPGSSEVYGRFEAAAANDRWTGDALHGPKIGGRKTYLFAFLDDHSRTIVGYRFGFAEDTVRLATSLKPALAARGIPAEVYVDNGSAFVDAWLLRACATLGIRLVHSTPRRPQGRGKIERFFRTVREQFLVEVPDTTADDLAAAGSDHTSALLELNRLLTGWIETEYHRRIHTETGQSPLARWDQSWSGRGGPALPDAATLTEAFLWSQYRVVTKAATVSLHGNRYEVDAALTGRKVELVFDPFDLTCIDVRYRDTSYGQAAVHTISRHTHPKARPGPADTPAPATGINYLDLVADGHDQQIRGDHRIGYHALYPAETTSAETADNDPGPGAAAGGHDGQIPGQLSIDDATAAATAADAEGAA